MSEISAVEVAKKQRYAMLLSRVKDNKTLSSAELEELRQYEDMAGKPEKQETGYKGQGMESNILSPKPKTLKNLTEADSQRLGFNCEDIAAADKISGLSQNLSKYFLKHPRIRAAFDRGRLLRTLVRTAPNCLIYEAAQRLKDLGFKQFQSARDLRDFLDKDKEANELWESARVNGAIENREALRKTALDGNVKAIELLEKWSADRMKETGESGGQNFHRVSTNQMAELFGVARQTILEWNKDKGLPRNTDETYDLHSAITWYDDYIRKLSMRGNNAVTNLNPFQAVKTERERLKLEQDLGELLERGAVIGFQVTMIQNVVNSFNAITDLANRVFSQPREEIVARLEDFRDEVMAKLQHVPAELKLTVEAEKKLVELFELIKPNSAAEVTEKEIL